MAAPGVPGGMHHVSALSAHIGASHRFYTEVLGLRPLIRTVNQDDPSMYHLFYGDGAGSPGSDMTVFDLRHAAPEFRGNNRISRTTFRVSGQAALDWWAARLTQLGIAHDHLRFDDAVGTELAIIDDGGAGDGVAWDASPVPREFQIRGLGFPELTVPDAGPTTHFLTEVLGLEDGLIRVIESDEPRARYGSGGVHHFALRVPDGQPMAEWVRHLDALGYRNSGIVDRHYFQSIYVREPNDILIELATEGPGFTVDGPLGTERLSLPPFLEPRRAEIETRVSPWPPG